MTRFVVAIAILFTTSIQAAETFSLGEKLKPTKRPDKSPDVSLVYSYDVDWAWMVTFRSTITPAELAALPDEIHWTVFDPEKNEVLSTWQTTPKETLSLGQLKVSDALQVRKILLARKDLVVQFARHEGGSLYASLYYLPLTPICVDYPENVKDLTNTNASACAVDPADLDNEAAKCAKLRLEFFQLISEGSLTCDIARDFYKDLGCGELDCR